MVNSQIVNKVAWSLACVLLLAACKEDEQCRMERYVRLYAGFYQMNLNAASGERTEGRLYVDTLSVQGMGLDGYIYDRVPRKDSVQLAAAADAGDGIVWFVADLASIPVRAASADCVLNVFSPANYAEFRRALAPGGIVVKAVPTPRHLQELRAAAAGQLAHAAYENDRVLGHFAESCALIERRTAGGAFPVDAETVRALAAMTPLFFHVDAARVDLRAVRKVTVEAEILVGRMA